MQDRPSSGLTSPRFAGRLRYQHRSSVYARRSVDGVLLPIPLATPVSSPQLAQPVQIQTSQRVTTVVRNSVAAPRRVSSFDLVPERPVQGYEDSHKALVEISSFPKQIPSSELKRSSAENQVSTSGHRSFKIPQLNSSNVMIAMACLVFISGLAVSINGLLINRRVKHQVAAVTHTSSADVDNTVVSTDDVGSSNSTTPSERPVSSQAVNAYVVPGDTPRYIKIPKLRVNARVGQMGLTRSGELATPYDIYDTGWYKSSAKPGVDAGAVLIDGHVSGPTSAGVFYKIKTLLPGDKIEIVRGDGQVVTYEVVTTKTYDRTKVDMVDLLSSIKPGKQGLNLITCAGNFDQSAHQYNERVVVYAVQQ